MEKHLWIYDVDEKEEEVFSRMSGENLMFSASPGVKSCIGCFGCWIKTPGRCLIQDRCAVLPSYLAQAGKVTIISPIRYGGYSTKIKTVLDRSIGFLLPYFRIAGGEMHHQIRQESPSVLRVCFYGTCSEEERATAQSLVRANAVNLGIPSCTAEFYESVQEMKEAVL